MAETIITARVDRSIARGIDFFSKLRKEDRSATTRKLLAKSLEEEKLAYALERYQRREITLGKAAELLGKDLREMMVIASGRGIPFQFSLKSLREDFQAAQKSK